MGDKTLLVQWDKELVGAIEPRRNGRIVFSYAQEWLDTRRRPISLSLPCSQKSFDAQKSTAFFDNLLPEEHMLKELCRANRIAEDDTYAILRLFGQDCAGALVVAPEGEAEETPAPAYQDITGELEDILSRNSGGPQGSLIVETSARLSIAGAQNKLPVYYDQGRFSVPEPHSHAPTNAILKPISPRFPDLHRNELFCMELARATGLPTPEAIILQIGASPAYVVMRYDRKVVDGNLVRIHQEDFCQVLGVSRLFKYQEHGGPGFASSSRLLLNPLLTKDETARERFIQCAVFNYVIGNCDAHGKNFSLLYEQDGQAALAPFYDLASTMAYPELDQKFAMAIGKTYRFDRPPFYIDEHFWKQFAADMNIRFDLLKEIIQKTCATLQAAVEPLMEKHVGLYGPAPIYDKIARVVRDGLRRLEDLSGIYVSP
jgi:serine/threonine-protein kinase HipA